MPHAHPQLSQRLDELQRRLRQENEILVDVVRAFRALDQVAYRMGLLEPRSSYASRISWWPMVSVLGTFSAGKSSFVNHLLGQQVQRTGNQAVDDKFTVLCYSPTSEAAVLPGIALDADPRFPFFRMSEQIERVAPGEGQRMDAYLQLKTCSSEVLKGRVLIDSPGFDADAQRTSVLRIVDHIIDLSDLVLVFFDARRPEPGAMRDTLRHLVGNTIRRVDSGKFLYVLNQIDTTAREDNAEEIVAAWQRALSLEGLSTGRFYCIFNPDVAVPIDDPELRARYTRKRDADYAAILARLHNVESDRAYRIVAALEKTARTLAEHTGPRLALALREWRRRVLVFDGVVFGGLLLLAGAVWFGGVAAESRAAWWQALGDSWLLSAVVAAIVLGGAFYLHLMVRTAAAKYVGRRLESEGDPAAGSPRSVGTGDLRRAFEHSVRHWRPLWSRRPLGFSRRAERRVLEIAGDTTIFVRKLNDHFANAAEIETPEPSEVR